MPPRKRVAAQTLSSHIDESTGDEAVSVEIRKEAPAKRAARGKATAEKKTAPARSRRKAAAVAAVAAAAEEEEEELTEDDMDPIEDDEMGDTVVVGPEAGPKKSGGRKAAKREPARRRGGRKAAAVEETESEEGENTGSEVPDPEVGKRGGGKVATGKGDIPVTSAPEKKKRMTKKEKDAAARKKVERERAEREIAETQFEAMEVDPLSEHNTTEDEELEIAPTPTQVHRAGVTSEKTVSANAKRRVKARKVGEPAVEEVHTEEEDDLAKSTKAPATVAPPVRGRGKKNPANDDGEAYKDLEKAYQALQTRYNNLQEAKETEAEQALKKFQKNMKEKDEERSQVIETLRSDLEAQQKAQEGFSAETKVLKKKLATKETELSKLQTKVQELSKSLQDQQNESKVMSAKLVQAQAQRNNAQVPGSAVKPGYRGTLGNPKANSGAVDDAWLARVKEDLYADLCGLIIVNVRKENDSNVFECVQTGVNGLAVHFKLSVPNRHVKAKKTPATQESKDPADVEEADENEIIFIPLFDETRDKAVIDLLPVYLRDEISFQRDHMTKFYQKINSLFMMTITTQQPEEGESEEDDDGSEEGEGEEEEE